MAVELAKIFQPGMLLQREMPVKIWGTGTPGEKIQITIQGKCADTVASADGAWDVTIQPLETSFHENMTVQGESNHIVIDDIAVGEVFVAAGQSNMEFWMRYEKHYQDMLPSCENENIRFYDIPKIAYDGQEDDFDYHNVGIWRKAGVKDLEYFSSIGYYFSRKLEDELSFPVGIIGCNWGGTRSLTWMKEEHARELQKEQTADFERQLNGQSYEEFCRTAGKNPVNDTGNSTWNPFNEFMLPRTPSAEEIAAFFGGDMNGEPPVEPAHPQDAPGALYQHMVLKAAPYTIRGVLWYQGESDDGINGSRDIQKKYKDALDCIKADWRDAWHQPDLPFFVVQLPGYYSWFGFGNVDYATIRECQKDSVDGDENAYLCSISDAGEEFDIHPKNKKVVGERLALLAEKYLYGMDILADAPRLKAATRENSRIVLSFENAEGGLSVDGDQVNALVVTDGDKEIAYTAEVSGEELILNLHGDILDSIKIKFARDSWYLVNLYNQAGIPAIPFETSC